MSREYVVQTAQIECNHGTTPSNLIVTPGRTVFMTGKPRANISDGKGMTNVMPFGMCSSPTNPGVIAAMGSPVPCTPTCVAWIGGKTDVLIQGMPALMTNDKAVCPLGVGMITIKDSGQGSAKKSNPPLKFAVLWGTKLKNWNDYTPEEQEELLDEKPLNSRVPEKWIKKGGKLAVSSNGTWQYVITVNGEEVTVNYKYKREGYPDFKEAGVVLQEVAIDPYMGNNTDFTRANHAAVKEGGVPLSDNSTWHHHEDLIHMQEIDKKIHKAFTHRGGRSLAKK